MNEEEPQKGDRKYDLVVDITLGNLAEALNMYLKSFGMISPECQFGSMIFPIDTSAVSEDGVFRIAATFLPVYDGSSTIH